jgi:60S ribosomal export protein nmd3
VRFSSWDVTIGLKQVKLIDAEFVWTEPHSKRIKLNLTVQKEAFGVVLQQSFIVCFIVEAKTCEDCIMESIEHSSKAVVQLRQKVVVHPIAHA